MRRMANKGPSIIIVDYISGVGPLLNMANWQPDIFNWALEGQEGSACIYIYICHSVSGMGKKVHRRRKESAVTVSK